MCWHGLKETSLSAEFINLVLDEVNEMEMSKDIADVCASWLVSELQRLRQGEDEDAADWRVH